MTVTLSYDITALPSSRCPLFGPDIVPAMITSPVPKIIKYSLGSSSPLLTSLPSYHIDSNTFPQCITSANYSLLVLDAATGIQITG